MAGRKVYGIAEIAEVLGERRQTVAQWRRRGKLPPPDEELAMGPVWMAATIEPWIRLQIEANAVRRRAEMMGDHATVAADKAFVAAEQAGLPYLYCMWVADAARAHASGVDERQWRREVIAGRGPKWEHRMDEAERLLRQHGLWPWT